MPAAPIEIGYASREAELAVLAAMTDSAQACLTAAALLEPAHFYLLPHAKIFAALVRIARNDDTPSYITLLAELEKSKDLDTCADTAHNIIEHFGSPANLEPNARIIRNAAAKRELRRLARELQARAEDPAESPSDILAALTTRAEHLKAEDSTAAGLGRFATHAISSTNMLALDIPAPRSLVGNGLFTAGGFGILYGLPGTGKSWLALQLALAIARGEPWLGSLATNSAGSRVGLVQLELGAYGLQQRLRALGAGSHGRDSDLHIVCRPMLKGAIDFYKEPSQLAELRQWITKAQLNAIFIDALSRAHSADENKAQEISPILAALDAIRHETSCAVLLVHHEPKPTGRDPDNHLDFLRGTSRLQSDPTLLVRAFQSRGLKCLTFAKVSEGITPPNIYYAINEQGVPVTVQSPESVKDDNRAKVLAVITNSPTPLTRAEVQQLVGLSPATVKRHLNSLTESGQVVSEGDYHNTRFRSSAQSAQYASEPIVNANTQRALGEAWQ